LSNISTDRVTTRTNLENGVIIALMLLVGLAGWTVSDRAELAVDPSPLARLPEKVGAWESMEIPMEPAVESELRADFNLQRAYVSRIQEPVVLYVGYYGTRRGGRPEHTPRGCYTGAGWGIEASRTLAFGETGRLRANEYLVERDGERQLVVFWYRSFRRTGILGGLDQNIDRLIGLLREGRADGALVRISTMIREGDVVGARSRLQSFASSIDPLLGEHWPIELACGDGKIGACAGARDERASIAAGRS
jgi:EpsI family protein